MSYTARSYTAKSYGDKSYADKSYGDRSYGEKSFKDSAYTNLDETAKAAYDQQLLKEKQKRKEAMHCEVAALVIGFVGLIGVAAVTGLPMWKVTAFIQENIIVMETRWEGLWMNCYRQANIRMQCKVYDSLLYLPAELQAARGLMCTAVALTVLACVISTIGMRCTRLVDSRPRVKHITLMVGGCLFLGGCVATLIPVSWTANVIIQDFYNPLLIDAQRRELGEALYIGWVSAAICFAAGVILLCRHAPRIDETEDVHSVLSRAQYAPYNNAYPGYTYYPSYSYQPAYGHHPPSVAYVPSAY